MKTLELSSAKHTVDFLNRRVGTENEVLHGSSRLDLPELLPYTTDHRRFHRESEREPLIYATKIAAIAIFYATVMRPVRDAQFHRACGTKPDPASEFGYQFQMSDAAKELIRRREKAGLCGAVYYISQAHFQPEGIEWIAKAPIPNPQSVATTTVCLPFNIWDLPAPQSDPWTREHHDQYGTPPETQLDEVNKVNISRQIARTAVSNCSLA